MNMYSPLRQIQKMQALPCEWRTITDLIQFLVNTPVYVKGPFHSSVVQDTPDFSNMQINSKKSCKALYVHVDCTLATCNNSWFKFVTPRNAIIAVSALLISRPWILRVETANISSCDMMMLFLPSSFYWSRHSLNCEAENLSFLNRLAHIFSIFQGLEVITTRGENHF